MCLDARNCHMTGWSYISAKKSRPTVLLTRLTLVKLVKASYEAPSTLIRHENGTFRKRSSNRRNLKTPAFRFHVDGNKTQFEDGAFRKLWLQDNYWISLPVFFHTNPKWLVISAFLNLTGVVRAESKACLEAYLEARGNKKELCNKFT